MTLSLRRTSALALVSSMALVLASCSGTPASGIDGAPLNDAGLGDAHAADVSHADIATDVPMDAGPCANPDQDGDGVRSVACGGTDCDDNDPDRFPGHPEMCRFVGIGGTDGGTVDGGVRFTRTDLAHGIDPTHDEDCDPTTFANAMIHDGDQDGDGYVDSACQNTDRSGMVYRGADCADLNDVGAMPASLMLSVAPAGIHPTAPELCNGVDDNCNGQVDEGNPGGGGTCGSGRPGVCAAGTSQCQMGALACTPNQMPMPEVCDGLDNNCNGIVDDGDPGGGSMCATGLAGVCSAGTMHCTAGSIHCAEQTPASMEVCNGLDDNCDGHVDEGDPAGGAACGTGRPGICSAGVIHCTGGSLACAETTPSRPETCNGVDDDCNGIVDDGDPGGGGGCSTGRAGVCAAGTNHCTSGSIACAENVAASPEVCNGLDDNCDGVADNVTSGASSCTPGTGARNTCPVCGGGPATGFNVGGQFCTASTCTWGACSSIGPRTSFSNYVGSYGGGTNQCVGLTGNVNVPYSPGDGTACNVAIVDLGWLPPGSYTVTFQHYDYSVLVTPVMHVLFSSTVGWDVVSNTLGGLQTFNWSFTVSSCQDVTMTIQSFPSYYMGTPYRGGDGVGMVQIYGPF